MVLVGVLVNPIAGFGGALALHGTDTLPPERYDEAVRAGRSAGRLRQALDRVLGRDLDAGAAAEFVAAPGLLGSDHLAASGIRHRVVEMAAPTLPTGRDDTIAAARALVAAGVDVLVFAGGDGTATDIAHAIGTGTPVIGVPSGVKMHSEVFTRSPAAGGRLLAEFVAGRTRSQPAEVLDVGADDVSAVVAVLTAPRSREALQGAKASGRSPASGPASHAIALGLLDEAAVDSTWIIGPGHTAGAVAEALGFVPTLRGVDVQHASGVVERDVDEERLHRIVGEAAQPRLVLGVVGGQGFLLGRGNQQLSPRVIDSLGAERIEIVATGEKVGGLFPAVLYVDVEQPVGLLGYRRVRIGARHSTVMKVSAA